MKKPNLLVVGIMLAIVALVALLPMIIPQIRTIDANAPAVAVTQAATAVPQATQAPTEAPTTVPQAEEATATDVQAAQTTATDLQAAEATATDLHDEATATDLQAAEELNIEAYLILTVQGMVYEPLPLTGEGTFTIRQDEETYNTVHITPASVWMEHSSCDNQDCVEQGVVSLENMTSRVLYNMVICLPNQVSLELHTPETLLDAFGLAQ